MLSEMKVLVILWVFVFYLMSVVKADTFEECKDVDADTYVASSESCSAYILCNGDESELFECDEGEYFDIESEACDAKENVVCPLDNNEDEDEDSEGVDEDDVVSTPTPATIVTTTSPIVTLTTTPSQTLDIPPIVKDSCPATDDPNQIVYISSSNSCSVYFVCYHGHPVEMHCTDHLHFNALTGKCDFPENSNCKISIQPPSATNKCLPHVTDFFPHPRKCNYFFYCIKGYQTLQQCPFYYGWDIERRTCVHMAHVKCYDATH